MKANGTIDRWPRRDEYALRRQNPNYCHCYTPIPERIGGFAAVQCKKCGRKLPDD